MRAAHLLSAAMAALVLSALSVAAQAQSDPPGRVGRLDLVDGQVWYENASDSQWTAATPNYPVTTGANFWAAANARAEIEVGPEVMRLDQNSVAGFQRLDDQATQIQLTQGSMNVSVASLPAGAIQVVTPNGEVDLVSPGSYDIDAGQPNTNTPSRITVFQGQAQVVGGTPVPIGASQAANFSGGSGGVVMVPATPTPFDQWAFSRDAAMQQAAAPSYIPPAMTGYQDLAQAGSWSSDPTYGEVWYPNSVPSGWEPYHYGHWAYVPPWGWTWIDDEPWGFAPFHYGRWAYIGDRWAWYPGQVEAAPVYAPALVAFIGGAGFSVALTAGSGLAVGWVPLAPFEPYHPYYHVSNTYLVQVNRPAVHAAQLADIARAQPAAFSSANFANRRAVTVVARTSFTSAAAVQRSAVNVPADRLAQARVATAATASTALPAPSRARPAGGRPNPPTTGPRPATATAHSFAAHPAAVVAHPTAPTAAPAGARPEAARPEGTRPEANRPAAPVTPQTRPVAPVNPRTRPVAPRAATPEAARPETARPATPEAARPEAARRAETPRAAEPAARPAAPEAARREATPARPEAAPARHEAAPARPEAARPEAARPAQASRPAAAPRPAPAPKAAPPANDQKKDNP